MAYSGKKTLFGNGFIHPNVKLSDDQRTEAKEILEHAGLDVPTSFLGVFEAMALSQSREDMSGASSKTFSMINEAAVGSGSMFAYNASMANQGAVTVPGISNSLFPAQVNANVTPGSADTFPVLFPIAVQPVRKTNFFDFLGSKAIFQMNSQSAMLYFMDGKYSGGRLNSSIPAKYFEATQINPTVTVTDTMTAGTFNGGTAFTTFAGIPYGSLVAVAPAGSTTITAGTGVIAGAALVVQASLIYTGVNPYSGNAIFQVLSIDSAASTLEGAIASANTMYFLSKANVNSEGAIIDTIIGGSAVVEATLALTSKNAIKLVSETEVVNYGFTMIDTADYLTPRFSGYTPEGNYINYSANNTAGTIGDPNFLSSANTQFAGLTRAQLENYVPSKVDIQIQSRLVEATGAAVRGTMSIVQGQDFRSMFKVDGPGAVKELMGNAIAQDLNAIGNTYISGLGTRATTTCDRVEGTSLSASPEMFGTNVAAGIVDNTITFQRRMVTVLKLAATMVGHRNRNDKSADTAIIGKRFGAALIDNKENVYNPTDIVAEDKEVVLGTLGGIKLIKATDRKFGYNTVVFGQTATNESDNGLKFCPYIMAALTETVAETTHAWSSQLTSRFAFVESGWYPENAYLKVAFNAEDVYKIAGQKRL